MINSLESEVRLVIHPQTLELYPDMVRYLQAGLSDIARVSEVNPHSYPDYTPSMFITDIKPRTHLALVPGFISGPTAMEQLIALTQTAHTLRFAHPDDDRSPWVQQCHLLLSDLEGRGNKITIGIDGNSVVHPELHYMHYIANLLRASGVTEATILDPHDIETVKALAFQVNTITALPEIITYMQQQGLITHDSVVVIADNGAIGRSLYFADTANLPINARIIKKRVNGKVRIEDILGKDEIEGKRVILVDDMIATGETLFTDAEALRKLGAIRITGVVTHVKGVDGVEAKVSQHLSSTEPILNELVITNSTPYHSNLVPIPGVRTVNIFPLMLRAARYVLDPTEENRLQMLKDTFPIKSVRRSLGQLNSLYPHLAPDYVGTTIYSPLY